MCPAYYIRVATHPTPPTLPHPTYPSQDFLTLPAYDILVATEFGPTYGAPQRSKL